MVKPLMCYDSCMTDVSLHSSPGTGRRRRSYRPPLRTAGQAWGPLRVRRGMAMRELERLSGVNRWILSLAEQGRLVPTGGEMDAVMAVLLPEAEGADTAGGEASPGDPAG